MLQVDLNFVGFEELVKKLDMRKERVQRAVVDALNRTGSGVLDALTAEMSTAFDRPTPYTLGSLRLDRATSSNMFARIAPKDFAGKGTPAKNYLGPEIFGGERHEKRSEVALRSRGILPAGLYTAPGKGATLDAYGNQSVGEIRQILSYFGSAEMTAGYTSNMTDKTRARLARGTKKQGFGYSYFVIRTHQGNLAPGIYKKLNFAAGHAIKPILMFVKKPTYSKRYRWHEVAGTTARQMFERYLVEELAKGI